MPDGGIEVRDEHLGPGQHRWVQTRAWWTAFHGLGPELGGPYTVMAEQLLTEWIPADPAQEWLWDRRLTGAQQWLAGSEDDARGHGIDLSPPWPTGQWQAPFGDYFAGESGRPPRPREPSWQHPTSEFLAGLPRDPQGLRERLEADSPPPRTGYCGPLTYACDVLATGRVPAAVRAALYAALRLVPGVGVTSGQDAVGRAGVAFVHHDEARRAEVIVDPDGGQFLGERDTLNQALPEHGLPAGTTIAATSVRVAVASALGAAPEPHG